MKQRSALLFMLLYSFTQVRAQEMHPKNNPYKFYLGIEGGYAFKLAGGYVGHFSNSGSLLSATHTPGFTLGRGVCGGMNMGYILTKHICIEFGASYLISSNYDWNNSYPVLTWHGDMVRLVPALRFQTEEGPLLLYSRTGLSIGFPQSVQSESIYLNNWQQQIDQISNYSGRTSYGMQSALGVSYHMAHRMNIFLEFCVTMQTWDPASMEYTKYTNNGVNMLPGMTVSQIQTVYVANYNGHINYLHGYQPGFPPNAPTPEPLISIPFSSAGITIGIQFPFGKHFITGKARYDLTTVN